jgi:hypothetical protein
MAKKQPPKQLPARGKSRGKGSRYERNVLIGIVIAVIAIGLTLWGPLKKFRPAEMKQSRAGRTDTTHKKQADADREATKKRENVPARANGNGPALVAIVIDDLGQDLKAAREIMSLPGRITMAVMPGLPQSRGVAELARQNKREVLLHLPMEHRNRNGRRAPGILLSDMTPMDFLSTLSTNVESVPGAMGVNNHEGSLLTENTEAMKFLMAELKARDLMFLDSMTSPKSVAYATAKEFGLRSAKRDVFLDNDGSDADAVQGRLEELGRIARDRGRAVGIGHPYPATINALRKWLAEADQQGLTIVPLSKIAQ